MQAQKSASCFAGKLVVILATLLLGIATPGLASAQKKVGAGEILGMAFDGHQVSDLNTSIKFYETLGFKLVGKVGGWKLDKAVNKLGDTKGAETRTAILSTQSSVSDIPFHLILRQYRGIKRQNWSSLSSSALGSGHMDLTVQGDCRIVMNKLKAIGMLRVPKMNLRGGGGKGQPLRFAFVQDPDGWFIELFAILPRKPGSPPPGPKVSNSSATMANIDRLGKQAGFNHIGLNVINPKRVLAFYQGFMGGDYAPLKPPRANANGKSNPMSRMVMMNGWFPQANAHTNRHLRLELIKFPQNEGKQPPPEHFQDVNVNYVGFQVKDIDAVYAGAKAAGAITVSDGGIVKVADGRAVIIRDPDVGGFDELWEPSK